MESDGDDLENIFEEHENIENDREADSVENAQSTSEPSGVKVPVPKRIVRNPRLKFNPERLCGERGIPVLVDHFKGVKFKGVGHEKEDLDKLLTKLEHWTHRLFPSMKFKDCLHHIEKLGKKRPVQTCLRKMRLNMAILSSDFVNDDDDDVHRVEDSEPVQIDAFDKLIGESQDVLNQSVSAEENIADLCLLRSSPVQSSHGIGQVLGSGSSLTAEQKERMEHNRMLAAERRKARLAAMQQNPSESQSLNEEIIPSQDVSNMHKNTSESSSKNQEHLSSIADDLFAKFCSDDKLSVEEGIPPLIPPLELNNQNSENLGLEDLIDLVDEEEPVPGKNSTTLFFEEHKTVCSSMDKADEFSHNDVAQLNSPSFEQNVGIIISDNTDTKMVSIPDKISKIDNEENSGNVSTSDNTNTELLISDEISKIDNKENLGNASISDNTNTGMVISDEIFKIDSEENLEIESLLDLVNEETEDIQINSDPSCSV